FPVIGTAIGAGIGAVAGGLSGFAAGGGFGGGGTVTAAAIKTGTSEMARQAATMASEGGKVGVDVMAKTFTASSATIPVTATTYSLSGAVIGASIFSTMAITVVMAAFLPDASTVQVAPSFSLDI